MADWPSNTPWQGGSSEENAWMSGVFEQHGHAAWLLAVQIVGETRDAENVLQESFLKLLRKARSQAIDNPCAYLNAVIRTTALDVLAKRRADKSARMARANRTPKQQDNPSELLEQMELLGQLDRAITKLPLHLAKVIIGRDLCQQSYEQIARSMGIGRNTARVYHWRAVRQLQQILRVN